jgi:hypothetical protein
MPKTRIINKAEKKVDAENWQKVAQLSRMIFVRMYAILVPCLPAM